MVFNRFKTTGLKIKLSKCQFFKTQLHYLGHKISADRLEPLPEKAKAIKNLAPTKNVDEACQILGLLGYYRSLAPAFADTTTPINNAYSSVLCQPQSNDNNIRPAAYFSGTFTAQNNIWCATEKKHTPC